MNFKWQQAPIRTARGDDMVVASFAIDKDHTVCLYCERDQTPKVDAMFEQQERGAWIEMVVANLVREGVNKHKARELAQHFYTSPPAQRKPLTKVEVDAWDLPDHPTVFEFVQFIEAKLRSNT